MQPVCRELRIHTRWRVGGGGFESAVQPCSATTIRERQIRTADKRVVTRTVLIQKSQAKI